MQDSRKQNTPITKFKWFWAWQDDKEEAWLAAMAREGYHLEAPVFPCVYRFAAGDPADIVYRLDYPLLKTQDRASYLRLFQDAGWEHVGDMVGWMYFRRPRVEDAPLEIFSDVDSKIQKYQRILAFVIIFIPIFVVIIPDFDSENMTIVENVLFVFFTSILLFFAFAAFNLFRRILQLRQSK